MPSCVQVPQRKQRFIESTTVYNNQYSDVLSSEYLTSGGNTAMNGESMYTMAKKAVDDEVRRALKAQERAQARRAVHDSSPRRTVVTHVARAMHHSVSLYPTMARMDEFDSPSRESSTMDIHTARTKRMTAGVVIAYEATRPSSNPFDRVRDSLTLPYLRSRTRTQSKAKPPMLYLPPGINQQERRVVVEQVYPESTKRHPYAPPRKLSSVHRESPKQLAPLPPFDPYARPRADSLSAVREDRKLCYSPPLKQQCERNIAMHSTSNSRLRRMQTMDDLSDSIYKQAATWPRDCMISVCN